MGMFYFLVGRNMQASVLDAYRAVLSLGRLCMAPCYDLVWKHAECPTYTPYDVEVLSRPR